MEILLAMITLLVFSFVVIKIKLATHARQHRAQEELINIQSRLLQEAEALVGDGELSEDDFYEKSKEISKRLDEIKSLKAKI